MSEKRFDFSLGACKIYDKQEERLLEDTEVCGLLNEQISIIRRDEMSIKTMMSNMEKLEKENERIKQMYLKKLDKRERQIDIMKFHILNFCTDEQIQSIRNDLEIESKLRRWEK